MKRIFLASAFLLSAACASVGSGIGSGPTGPSGPPSGFVEEAMSGVRFRIVYASPKDVSAKLVSERTLARAAELTLAKGNEWFEIASKIDGKNTQTLVIVMGKGEALAGGPKQYNAKETLASLKPRIG
jgi:hypothetical protein